MSDGHGALGAAVGAGVGRPPARAGGDAEDVAPPGGRHERQGGAEDVAVAVEVHREHAAPVLVAARGEAGGPGDAGDVDHGVEPAELVGQLVEQLRERPLVGDRHRRRPRGAAGGDDAAGGGLLGRGELLGAVDGDQRVDGDDESACAAELLGDRGADPAAAAGDDDDPLPVASRQVQPVEVARLRASPRAARGSRSSRRSLGRSCLSRGFMPPGSPSLLMRDGVQADMTPLASTKVSTICSDPVRLGLGAHVEHLDALLLEQRHRAGDELGAEHGQLGVVDGDDRLLAGCRHDEHVREAAAHHPEQAGGAVGPLLGERDAVPADDVVAGAARQRRDLGLEAGAVDDAVDLVLLPVDDRARAR